MRVQGPAKGRVRRREGWWRRRRWRNRNSSSSRSCSSGQVQSAVFTFLTISSKLCVIEVKHLRTQALTEVPLMTLRLHCACFCDDSAASWCRVTAREPSHCSLIPCDFILTLINLRESGARPEQKSGTVALLKRCISFFFFFFLTLQETASPPDLQSLTGRKPSVRGGKDLRLFLFYSA